MKYQIHIIFISNLSVKQHFFIGRKPYHQLLPIEKEENKAGGRRNRSSGEDYLDFCLLRWNSLIVTVSRLLRVKED